jgi:hypothetical protein
LTAVGVQLDAITNGAVTAMVDNAVMTGERLSSRRARRP